VTSVSTPLQPQRQDSTTSVARNVLTKVFLDIFYMQDYLRSLSLV
jgi:hypothetical protein